MRNKRDITINVIKSDVINNRKLVEYFAKKYEKETQKIQLQGYQKS